MQGKGQNLEIDARPDGSVIDRLKRPEVVSVAVAVHCGPELMELMESHINRFIEYNPSDGFVTRRLC